MNEGSHGECCLPRRWLGLLRTGRWGPASFLSWHQNLPYPTACQVRAIPYQNADMATQSFLCYPAQATLHGARSAPPCLLQGLEVEAASAGSPLQRQQTAPVAGSHSAQEGPQADRSGSETEQAGAGQRPRAGRLRHRHRRSSAAGLAAKQATTSSRDEPSGECDPSLLCNPAVLCPTPCAVRRNIL